MTPQEMWADMNGKPFDQSLPGDRAAAFLLNAAIIGDLERAAEGLDLPEGEAELFDRRARENGIFRDGKIQCDWMDEESGYHAFLLDTMCLNGVLQRSA